MLLLVKSMKMQRHMFGTFRDYVEQVKMAGKFSEDNKGYEWFVKRQIHLINEIDDDKKLIILLNLQGVICWLKWIMLCIINSQSF